MLCLVVWLGCAPRPALADGAKKAATAADIKKDFHHTARAIRNETLARKKALAKKIHSSLSALNKSIKRFKSDAQRNWAKMDKMAREKSARALQSFKRQHGETGTWCNRLLRRSARAWRQMRRDLAGRWRTLQKTFERAEKGKPRRAFPSQDATKRC